MIDPPVEWSDPPPRNVDKPKMQDTVDEMCHILENEFERYEISTHTVNFDNGVELWRGDMSRVWKHSTPVRVFSEQQSVQLRNSFNIGMKQKRTTAQEELDELFLPQPEPEVAIEEIQPVKKKKWWLLWLA